jgi:phosphonate transport system ATP-binding protein
VTSVQVVALTNFSVRHAAARADAVTIQEVNLQVTRGEVVAIIGPSGAGKTTLLHAVACALKPVSGSMSLLQTQPWTLSRSALHQLRARLFLAPQTPPLPPRQRVVTAALAGQLPALSFWASVRSLFYPVDMAAAQAALAHFDMADKLFERVDRLSGGERQRVGLARALVSSAELMLVDEPLSALDPTRSHQAITALVSAARERGATLITTLHQVEVARAHFERIVALRDGRIAFDAPASEVTDAMLRDLYADHEDELTASLEGAAPAIEAAPQVIEITRTMTCR